VGVGQRRGTEGSIGNKVAHARTHTHARRNTHDTHAHIHTHAHLHTHTRTHTHTRMTRAHVTTHMHTCIQTRTHTCTHIHMHTQTHWGLGKREGQKGAWGTKTHTHTHTHTRAETWARAHDGHAQAEHTRLQARVICQDKQADKRANKGKVHEGRFKARAHKRDVQCKHPGNGTGRVVVTVPQCQGWIDCDSILIIESCNAQAPLVPTQHVITADLMHF